MFNRVQISLAITLLSLGILMSIQFRTTQEALKSLTAQTQQDLAITLKSLSEKKYTLQKELWDMQVKLDSLESANTQRKDVIKSLQDELSEMNGASGAAALKGPGITVTIPARTPLISDELLSIVNELWNVGAEGVAVNGIRITSFTPIYDGQVGAAAGILVEDQPLQYPLVINAVGDSDKLLNGINIAGGTLDLLRVNKITIDVEKKPELIIPVAKQPLKFGYAKTVDQPTEAVTPN